MSRLQLELRDNMVLKNLRKFTRGTSPKEMLKGQAELIRDTFDAAFYARCNPDLSGAGDLLEHYLREGWREGRDPTEWFSVKAYLAAYPDVAAAQIDPFGHYLAHGKAEARILAPAEGTELWALHAFFDATGVYLRDFPEQFRAGAYAIAAGLPGINRWQLLANFINSGIFVPRLVAVAQPDPTLLEAIGDVVAHNDRAKALKCYQLAELWGERNAELMHKLGDSYLHFGQLEPARSAYVAAIELGSRYYWTIHNLGVVSSSLGQFDFASTYFTEAYKLRPEKYSARYKARRAAAERFDVQWIVANGLAISNDDEAATTLMKEAIADYRNMTASSTAFRPLTKMPRSSAFRIAIFGSDSLPQCKLYRITQKVDQLDANGQVSDFFPLSRATEFLRKVQFYDIVIVYRAPATPEVVDVLERANAFGIVTFYDIDDLIFDETCYPPSRSSLGQMVTQTEYAGLVTGRALFREAMAMCDYGIASTPPIQRVMASIVRRKHCFLSRNALGYAHLNNQEISDRSGRSSAARFILFYGSGSRSHNENFALMAKSLADLLRRNPQIQLRIVGPVEISSALAKVQNQIERIPFTEKVSDYWRQLATANVNLAPLTSNAFNDAKSEIKWMEAAILGIPSIVSSSAVYDELIRHGKDGFIAKTEEDWGEIIDRLLVTPGLASSVGANARERVFADYDLRAGGANLLAILKRGRDEKLDEERRIAPRKEPLILVVNIFFPPEFIGGATRVVEQTINDVLSKSRDMFSIEVFCGRDPDGSPGMIERYEWNGVPVTSLSPFGDVDSIERSVETESLFATYLDMLGPDLIHFHCIQRLGASLLDVALAKGIPYVVSAHDGWWISDHQFLIDQAGVPVYESGTWGDVRRLERLKSVLNRGRATIAVSQSQARLYSSRGINNVITIANGSETLAEVDAAPSEGPVWLGLLGGLGLPKGSLLLEEALRRRRYANLRFLVVDHSMPEGDVRHALWGSNEVELVGKTSFASVAKIYSRIHALLAISVCVESFGLVAREAQRLGRWVIGSDRGGMAEDINEGEDGFVVDPSRVDDLIRVLDTIDAHPERYRLPPRKIKQLRGREEVAMELIKLYRSILEVPESEM